MRPIRKRGFYRALKRGELWAVLENNMNKAMKGLTDSYANALYNYIMKPSPFLNMTGLSQWLPIEYGDDEK